MYEHKSAYYKKAGDDKCTLFLFHPWYSLFIKIETAEFF